MDVILHLGAHRTGMASLCAYLRAQEAGLHGAGLAVWDRGRLRNGLLDGVCDAPDAHVVGRRGPGRVRLNRALAEARGRHALLVSDAAVIGSLQGALRSRCLYPGAGLRVSRLDAALGPIRRVALSIRSPEAWWASALAALVERGAPLPDAATLEAIAAGRRGWRGLVADIACAVPEADLVVLPFERFGGQPDRVFAAITGHPAPRTLAPGTIHANARPALPALRRALSDRGEDPCRLPGGDGRWQPFSDAQAACLRRSYAEDLVWLRGGADGLARLIEEDGTAEPGLTLAASLQKRGRQNDRPARRLARPRRERTARPPA